VIRKSAMFFCLILALAISQIASAQVEKVKELVTGKKSINTDFVPPTAFAGAVAFPKTMAEDPKFDLFPREIVTAWGKKELGFDPMLIEQATFVVRNVDSLEGPPTWGAILHFEEMQGLAGGLIDRMEKKRVGDKVMFSGESQGLPSLLVYDEATIFVGKGETQTDTETFFAEMVAANNKGNLVRRFKRAQVNGQIQAFADFESVRPLLNQLTNMMPGMLPPAIGKLKSVPDMIDAIEVGLDVTELKTMLVIHAADEETAEEAHKIIQDAMELGADMGIGLMASQMDFDDPIQEATVEYAQRMSEQYKVEFMPKQNGKSLSMNLNQTSTIVPFAVGMLLPAVQQVREAARRTQSMNNQRQMALAGHNYESAYGHFPTQGTYDKNGKPLLSWRVQILPFIEQQELYDQFHHDEPWDSPHNRKLISKMPEVFQSPSLPQMGGKTVYLGVAGEGMIFNKDQKIDFSKITDGSSNTIYTIEADMSHAVEWTRPVDLQVDPKNPLDGLGRLRPGGFIATMADGSVQFISGNIDPEMLMNMFKIGDGNVIGGF